MSVSSIESLNSNNEFAENFEVLVDYEVSIDDDNPLVYTCTVTHINPTTNEITSATSTSFISGRTACRDAHRKVTAALQP